MLNAYQNIFETEPKPFEYSAPARIIRPVLVSAPHGGTYLPADFVENSVISSDWLLSTVDRGTDAIATMVNSLGMPALRANYARSYVDLNRERNEFDKSVVKNALPNHMTARLHAGYGVIPRAVAKGKQILAGPITQAEAEARLMRVYDPYHAQIHAALMNLKAEFGYAVIVDIHSTPTSALQSSDLELVIGTRRGTSLGAPVKSALSQTIVKSGFRLVYDYPFQGGFITEHYGNPRENIHAFQIEINRELIENRDTEGFAYVDNEKITALEQRFAHFFNTFISVLPRG